MYRENGFVKHIYLSKYKSKISKKRILALADIRDEVWTLCVYSKPFEP